MGKIKERLGMAALALVSVLAAYGLLEAGLHLSLTRWPAWMFNAQCRELRTLGQTSKAGVLPRARYIALIGDSYGSGQGDWFAENGYNLNSRYHAAHVLQDLSGRDVLSFSRAGAGNYDGAAIYAVNTFRLLRRLGFALPAPAEVLVYFYEGNDLSDNLRFKDRHYAPAFDPAQVYDDAAFARFEAAMDAAHCQGAFRELQDRFLAGNLLERTVEGALYAATKEPKAKAASGRYTALVGDRQVALPDDIAEDDLVRMPQEDKRLALRFFERALARVARLWPEARLHVVYIPAALSIYRLQGPDAAAIRAASGELEGLVRQAAEKNGCGFVSAGPALRRLAEKNLVHGPVDWHHLNRQGYTVLGELLAQAARID